MVKNADIYREGRRLDLYNEYVREGALNLRYGRYDVDSFRRLSESQRRERLAALRYDQLRQEI